MRIAGSKIGCFDVLCQLRRLKRWQWGLIGMSVALAVVAYFVVDAHRISSAPFSNDAWCGKVVDRAPEKIFSDSRDWVIGDGVASWGKQHLTLRCGVEELEPTVNLCVNADGVDWVLDEEKLKIDGVSSLTTYGRSPAVELTYSGPKEDVGGILSSLKSTVVGIPQHSKCLGEGDSF
ncbi:DUF3515 family protein [Streptomyces sp. cg28]|uniref:DUF3515 family protein n=1 Tax=Streptomyces sp. cg28 TaxID=3403457 RepID=UPI003B20C1C4